MALNLNELVKQALEMALQGLEEGEVPAGAVIASLDGNVLGRGQNRCINASDPTAHAEIVAIRDASRSLGNYRLTQTIMVCTLEPCPMCYAAILNARIPILAFSLEDEQMGAVSLGFDQKIKGWKAPVVIKGIGRTKYLEVIRSFFEARR